MANNILPNFLKVDRREDYECVINEQFIKYILKDSSKNCFYISLKLDESNKDNMFKVCRNDSYETWLKLNRIFE